jgi:L-ascorbate metabolism protein UlaG (beta-lactamase superfamily)
MPRFANLDSHIPIGHGALKWMWQRRLAGLPKPPAEGYAAFAQRSFMRPDFTAEPASAAPRVWWLGHATVLLRIAGLHIITDPHFSLRASPFSFIGPKRYVPAPAAADALPRIDVVLISHNHYDHLDDASIRALLRANPGIVFYAPSGLAPWLRNRGAMHVRELGWWQSHEYKALDIHCVPAQHWSSRYILDRNHTLWCGWVLRAKDFNFYFSGDTGYSPRLAEIASRLGSPDLAALPIGAYAPRWFMGPQHVDPPEAVKLHRELGIRHSLAIHWGTFELADDSLDEPDRLLRQALASQDMTEKDFWIIRQGEGRALRQK